MSNSDSHFPSNDTPDAARHARSTHQDFHWVEGAQRNTAYASFLETTLDVSGGLHTCLQIAYASELERAANLDADRGQTVLPAVSMLEADQLLRLSIATTALLRDAARRRVDDLNEDVMAQTAQA